MTNVVDESTAPDVDVLSVKRVLKQAHDIFSDSVLRRESFCPGQKRTRIDGGLLDREATESSASPHAQQRRLQGITGTIR